MKKVYSKLLAALLCAVIILSAAAPSVMAVPSVSASSEPETFVSSLLKSTKTVCLNKLIGWMADGFMNAMFEPKDSQEVTMLKEIQEQLSEVIAGQQKINDELKALEGLVEVQAHLEKLNGFTAKLKKCEPFFQCYDTLNRIDRDYEGQPEALKAQRLRALTEGLNISTVTSINTDADTAFLELYNAFVGPYSYTVNGKLFSGDLLDVFTEIKRYQYCWEHEAWDEMESFFNYAASSFALVSFIEVSSVQARIENCRLHNEGLSVSDTDYRSTASLETWLYNEGGIAANSDLESLVDNGEKVYSAHPVVRQDVYRHFWKPDHELRFYIEITNLGNHPVDEPLAGKGGTSAGSMFKNAKGLYMKGSGKNATLRDEFWNQFYQSAVYPNANLVTTNEINIMLEGCNHSKTLEEILSAGSFDYSSEDTTALLGLLLKKDDSQNPFVVDESHTENWQEYIGTLHTDKIRPYTRYIPVTQKNGVGKGGAAKYGTYYYYHTDDGSVKWNIQNNYTAGNLGQLFLYEDSCMHRHMHKIAGSEKECTCTISGKTADWYCEDCNKTIEGKIIPAKGHTISESWTSDVENHWKTCLVCKEKVDLQKHYSASGTVYLLNMCQCDICKSFFPSGPLFATKKAAQINTTFYDTLADAFAAAEPGDTVKLVADITKTNEDITVPEGVFLDLNHHILNTTGKITNNSCIILHQENADIIDNLINTVPGAYAADEEIKLPNTEAPDCIIPANTFFTAELEDGRLSLGFALGEEPLVWNKEIPAGIKLHAVYDLTLGGNIPDAKPATTVISNRVTLSDNITIGSNGSENGEAVLLIQSIYDDLFGDEIGVFNTNGKTITLNETGKLVVFSDIAFDESVIVSGVEGRSIIKKEDKTQKTVTYTVDAAPNEPEEPDSPNEPEEPTVPQEPTVPNEPEKPLSPQTGDTENVNFRIIMILISSLGIFASVTLGRKKKKI